MAVASTAAARSEGSSRRRQGKLAGALHALSDAPVVLALACVLAIPSIPLVPAIDPSLTATSPRNLLTPGGAVNVGILRLCAQCFHMKHVR